MQVKYESLIYTGSKVMAKVKVFWTVGQTSRSRTLGETLWYGVKGLVTRNVHVKYESLIYTGSKVTAKVKVFVHTHAHADARGMTIALRTFVPAS